MRLPGRFGRRQHPYAAYRLSGTLVWVCLVCGQRKHNWRHWDA